MARIRLNSWKTVLTAALFGIAAAAQAEDVLTYHNNRARHGWNRTETVLTPAAVKATSGTTFGLLYSVPLDQQVDAQPLVVSNWQIQGQPAKTATVVYVVTENNTLYAIDGGSGKVLLSRNFGPPVPQSVLPGQCDNNSNAVGITSTPVINRQTGVMYLIAYIKGSGKARYELHEVSLSTLADVSGSPVIVSASGKLTNGQSYQFDAGVSRQRAALLRANGNVYAGFASFCDASANVSRGWVLGWKEGTLAPLAANQLNNTLATSPNNFFLTAIWMSGYGLASPDEASDTGQQGDIYFVTGNSNSSYTIGPNNIAESAAQLAPDLSGVKSTYLPPNAAQLERTDGDFGSGGLMLLPAKAGSTPLAVAAGKDGTMYLLNASNLKTALGTYKIGGCWCGASYYQGSDGKDRVVTSGGNQARVWTVSGTTLQPAFSTATFNNTGQDPGFFTTVSSNGTAANSQIIWAVSRPNVVKGTSPFCGSSPNYTVNLAAFDGTTGATLKILAAGTWTSCNNDSDLVPTVANGKVFVASYKQLTIFGLASATQFVALAHPAPPALLVLPPGVHEIYAIIRAIDGKTLTVAKRDGTTLKVDTSVAQKNYTYDLPSVGGAMEFRGTLDKSGVLHATAVIHGKANPGLWPRDR